jgi:hypothetical protein
MLPAVFCRAERPQKLAPRTEKEDGQQTQQTDALGRHNEYSSAGRWPEVPVHGLAHGGWKGDRGGRARVWTLSRTGGSPPRSLWARTVYRGGSVKVTAPQANDTWSPSATIHLGRGTGEKRRMTRRVFDAGKAG